MDKGEMLELVDVLEWKYNLEAGLGDIYKLGFVNSTLFSDHPPFLAFMSDLPHDIRLLSYVPERYDNVSMEDTPIVRLDMSWKKQMPYVSDFREFVDSSQEALEIVLEIFENILDLGFIVEVSARDWKNPSRTLRVDTPEALFLERAAAGS